MNVLVIEDNPFDFRILDEMLKMSGDPALRLVHRPGLPEGLQAIEQEPWDLILLDLNLPGSSGMETFTTVSARAARIPIIIISAMDSSETAVEAVKSGAQDYLVKGKINTDLLVRSFRFAVERKRLEDQLRESEERYRELYRLSGEDVDERKKMESRLREAEDRYRGIFDGVGDGILVASRTGRILNANLSACKLYGYDRDDLLSRHVSEIVPEEYIRVLAADTAELRAKVPPHPIEAINVRAGGERFPVEMSMSAYPIGSHTVSLVVVRDIARRKQAEEAYRALVDRSLQELYIVQDNSIVFANQAAINNTGYTLEELQTFSPEEILYGSRAADEQASFTPPEQRKAARRTPSREEFRRVRKDGTTGWASTLVTDIQYQGRPARQIALIDVTERIQAEEAYRALVEQSLQELLIFQDGRVVFANPAAVENSGFSQEELLAFSADDLPRAVIHPDDIAFYEEGQRALLSGEETSVSQEIRVIGKDGRVRWVEALSICTGFRGKPSIQTVQFDVSERRQVEERLYYRHEIEALITSVSTRFINLTYDRIDSGIQQALQSLGRFIGVDRAYIYLLSSDWTRYEGIYEWCAEGVEERAGRLLGASFEPFRWSLRRYKGREAIVISRPEEFPEEAAAEREAAREGSIQSMLAIPLVLNNMLFGYWGFETVREEKAWVEEDVSLLRMMGDVFVNALARKQTEQALRRARQELDQVINSVSDALWTAEVDSDTGKLEYRYLSPVIEKITGRPPDYFKFNTAPWLSIIHSEDRDWAVENLDRTWKERAGLVDEEYRIVLPDGQVRWVRDSRSASVIAAGRVRLDAVLSDITERKQAEEAYRLLVEQSLQELLIFQEGRIIFANPAAVANSGYEMEELLSLSPEEINNLIHPDDREETTRISQERLAGRPVPERQEYRQARKDGSTRWVEAMSILIEYQGKPAVQSAQLDITERKLAEERLRHRVEIEGMVSNLSTGFINLSTEEVDSHIQDALEAIGSFTGADRCYLNLISPSGWRVQRSYQWMAEGIEPFADGVQGRDLKPFHWSMERLRRLEVVYVPRIAGLPPEAAYEKAYWQGQGRRSTLNIPLVLNESLFGTFGFANERAEREWAEEDIRLLQLMGDVFVNVLARKNAEEALIHSEAQYRLLADSISDIVALHELGGDIVYISPSIQVLSGKTPAEMTGRNVKRFIHPDDLWKIHDVEVRLAEKQDELIQLRIQNTAGNYLWLETRLHLIYKDGEPYQVLSTSRDITERKQAEQALYEANERLQRSIVDMEQRNREVTLLNELGDLLQGCLNLEDLYDVVGAMAPRLFPEESGALYIQTASKKMVEAAKTWGGDLGSEFLFAPDACWALRRGRIHSVNMPEEDLSCGHINDREPLSYLCIPMSAHGETMGLFYLRCRLANREEEPRCKPLAIMVAERVALAIANLRLRETLQRQSIRDSLTGLFNRRYMETTVERELRQAQRQNQSVGFIMIDLDHFKQFNDTYGHGAGDALLSALGDYLSSSIRGSDIACRYGGDEFVLILPQATLEDTVNRAEDVREGLKRITVNYKGMTLGPVTASVGISAYPDHGASMDPLLSLADTALYHAKDDGRDRVNIASRRVWEVE